MVKQGRGRRRRAPEAFGLVTIGGREWHHAWRQLVEVTGDVDCLARDPESGEVWQYLGSFKRDGVWRHEFRHRWHPRTRDRWVVHALASEGWAPRREAPNESRAPRAARRAGGGGGLHPP